MLFFSCTLSLSQLFVCRSVPLRFNQNQLQLCYLMTTLRVKKHPTRVPRGEASTPSSLCSENLFSSCIQSVMNHRCSRLPGRTKTHFTAEPFHKSTPRSFQTQLSKRAETGEGTRGVFGVPGVIDPTFTGANGSRIT